MYELALAILLTTLILGWLGWLVIPDPFDVLGSLAMAASVVGLVVLGLTYVWDMAI